MFWSSSAIHDRQCPETEVALLLAPGAGSWGSGPWTLGSELIANVVRVDYSTHVGLSEIPSDAESEFVDETFDHHDEHAAEIERFAGS